ncbi:hypothetical protein PCE1_001321 [Barthelona sp. PCE]
MLLVEKTSEGFVRVKRYNCQTEQMEYKILTFKDYCDIYWTSKDESTIATVHQSHIYVFRIPTLEKIYSIETDSEYVGNGCLSGDGQFLAFKGSGKYHIHSINSKRCISSVEFASGLKCWVNSEFLYVESFSSDTVFKFRYDMMDGIIDTINVDSSLVGYVMEDEENIYFWERSHKNGKNFLRLKTCSDVIVKEFELVEQVDSVLSCISTQYLVLGFSKRVILCNRNLETWIDLFFENVVENVYISLNEQHLTVAEFETAKVYNILNGIFVATVPLCCTGPTTAYDIVSEDFVGLLTPLSSFFYFGTSYVSYDSIYFAKPVIDGYLMFFLSKVVYITKRNCITQNYERHSGKIVNVEKDDNSVFYVEFDDGTMELVEWSKNDGFGRTLMLQKRIDVMPKTTIIDLCSIFVSKSEMELMFQNHISEMMLEMERKLSEMSKTPSQLDRYVAKHDTRIIQQSFLTSSVIELMNIFNNCAAEILQLKEPPESFFNWLTERPLVDSMFVHLGSINLAKEYVKSLKSVVRKYGFDDSHLSTSFDLHYNAIVAENRTVRILYKEKKNEMVEKLKVLDTHFNCYNQCLDLDLCDIHNQVVLFQSTKCEINVIKMNLRDIEKNMEDFRQIMFDDDAVNKTDFNSLFSIKEQVAQNLRPIIALETTYFSEAKNALIVELSDIQQSLNAIISEVSFKNVDIISVLEELNLSSIRFPFVPKVINLRYSLGRLRITRTQNSVQITEDLCCKCFCVSTLFDGNIERNIKSLRHELRVLTRFDTCVVELKGVTLVYKEAENEDPTLEFVCLELERAPYDLEQYLTEFPDLNEDTKISIAKQLIKCVLTMHTRGIMLRDIKPNNALVFCDEDGNNPIIKLCDFSDSIDPKLTNSTTRVGTVQYIPPELSEGNSNSFMGDIYSLGKTIWRVFGSPTNIQDLWPHSDILNECVLQKPLERPSIYKLALKLNIDFDMDLRREMIEFFLERQAIEDIENIEYEHFFQVFRSIRTYIIDRRTIFKDAIITFGDQRLHLTQYIRYLFQHRLVPPITSKSTDTDVKNMCTFLYCCLVFQAPIDDSQVGNFVLNALSCDFDQLSDAAVFARAFPMQSISIQNIASDDNLNFNLYGGEDVPVTDENLNEFMQRARENFVKEGWIKLSEDIHNTFYEFQLPEQLSSFTEIKAIMCEPPRFTLEKVLKALKFVDDMPEDLKESFETLLHGLDSLELTHFVHWLNGSTKLSQFTVAFHHDNTKPPLVSRVIRTLHIPNDAQCIGEIIRSAIRNFMPSDLKFHVLRTLSRYTTKDVEDLNESLQDALDIDITINGIDNVPSVRACPRCCTLVTYDGGCKSVKCPSCIFLFCFSCLSSICNPAGQCEVAPTQELTFEQVQDSMRQFS